MMTMNSEQQPNTIKPSAINSRSLQGCLPGRHSMALVFRDQEERISNVVESIMANYIGENVRSNDVAELFCVSQRTFTRRMQAEGISYREVINRVKKKAAEKLLLSSDASIADISKSLGYSDASNFTKAFKRWFGVSPRAFKCGKKK